MIILNNEVRDAMSQVQYFLNNLNNRYKDDCDNDLEDYEIDDFLFDLNDLIREIEFG